MVGPPRVGLGRRRHVLRRMGERRKEGLTKFKHEQNYKIRYEIVKFQQNSHLICVLPTKIHFALGKGKGMPPPGLEGFHPAVAMAMAKGKGKG